MPLQSEIRSLRFVIGYGDMLLAQIPAERFCEQPVAGMNHPAWIIGHLAYAMDGHSRFLGGQPILGDWKGLFGVGSAVQSDPSIYPSKDELVQAFHDAADRLVHAAETCDPAVLAQPAERPDPERLPTVGEAMTFMMVGHTAMHLGQLSAWCRAAGMARLF